MASEQDIRDDLEALMGSLADDVDETPAGCDSRPGIEWEAEAAHAALVLIDKLRADAEYGRALRRLEGWQDDVVHVSRARQDQESRREVKVYMPSNTDSGHPREFCVELESNHRSGVWGRGPTIAAAIHAALDAWEEGT